MIKGIQSSVGDRMSTSTFAHVTEEKGPSDVWIVDKIIEDIDRLGYIEVTLK